MTQHSYLVHPNVTLMACIGTADTSIASVALLPYEGFVILRDLCSRMYCSFMSVRLLGTPQWFRMVSDHVI